MMDRKLTLKDLSKDELILAVGAVPKAVEFFTEEIIARLMIARKIKEALGIDKIMNKSIAEINKCRSLKLKNELIKKHNAKVARYEKLARECKALSDRFPNIRTHKDV